MKARLKMEGIGFLTVALPAFCKAFDRALEIGSFSCPSGFSRIRGSSLPKFLSGLTEKIFDRKTGLLLEESDPRMVKIIREICLLFKKLELSSEQEDRLDSLAKKKFFDTEEAILEVFPEELSYYIDRVSSYILPNLDSWTRLFYKHGPGAVFEKGGPNTKWSLLAKAVEEQSPLLMDTEFDLEISLKSSQFPKSSSTSFGSEVRLVTVPKSSTARRTITVEPCLNQFVQQGLNDHLRSEIQKCSILKRCLTLDTQIPNQWLADLGSRTRRFCTIDLSSASDLLSDLVVRRVFHRHQRFLSLMEGSRTSKVKGYPLTLKKYAGMGNATTFPVQSICFAVVCIACILSEEKKFPSFREVVRVSSDSVHVFGDDIIVKNEYYSQVSTWLERLGLKVNQDKSYSNGFFRESCGLDSYKGVDVTPLYLRSLPSTSITPDNIEAIVSFINSSWESGRYYLSMTLLDQLESLIKFKLPLKRKDHGYLGLTNRSDAFEFQKWDSNYQRYMVRSYVSYSPKRLDEIDGYAAFLKFIFTPLLGRDDEHLKKSVRRFNLKHRKRWVHV
jgi:hypothetical protein